MKTLPKISFALFLFLVNFQMFKSAPLRGICASLNCPKQTTSCAQQSFTSSNRQELYTKTICYGEKGIVLSSKTSSKKNPNPDAIISSYNYFGGFEGFEETGIFEDFGFGEVSNNGENDSNNGKETQIVDGVPRHSNPIK